MKRFGKFFGIAVISSIMMSSFVSAPLAGETSKETGSFVFGDILGSSSNPFGLYNEEGQSHSKIALQVRFAHLKAYPGKWYIAGYDKATDSVVLLNSPEFNLGGKTAQASGAGWADDKELDPEADVKYTGTRPSVVGANHYGTGELRETLKALETTAFYPGERELMNDVTVYNYDEKNNSVYTTTDKIYLPYGNWWDEYITVGSNYVNSKESGNAMLNNGLKVSVNSGDVFASPVGNPYADPNNAPFYLRAPANPTDNDNCGQMLAVEPGDGTMYTYNNNTFVMLPVCHLKAKEILFVANVDHNTATQQNVLATDGVAKFRFKDTHDYIKAEVNTTEDGFEVNLGDQNAESYQQCGLIIYGEDSSGEWARSYSLQQTRKIKWKNVHEGVTGPEGLKIFIEYQRDNVIYAKMIAFKMTLEGLPGSNEKIEGVAPMEFDLKLPQFPINALEAIGAPESWTKEIPAGNRFEGWSINGKTYKVGETVRIDRETVIKPLIGKIPTATPTATPTVKPTNTPTPTVKPTNTPVPTAAATATPVPETTTEPEATPSPVVEPEVSVTAEVTDTPPAVVSSDIGKIVKVGKAKYKITSLTTATYMSFTDKKAKSATVPASIKYGGRVYKVTAVGSKAFSKKKKLKSVTIGKNVKTIAAKAFYKCSSVKTVNIKAVALKKVGKKAFSGINSRAVFKISKKKKLKSYKKLIKKSGVSKKVSYKVVTKAKKKATASKKK